MIYFLQATPGGPIKIGFTQNLAQRMQAFNVPCHLLAKVRGGRDTEAAVHSMLKAHRLYGEWYKSSPDVLKFIHDVQAAGEVPNAPNELSDRMGTILHMRRDGKSLREIGLIVHLSGERIRQILAPQPPAVARVTQCSKKIKAIESHLKANGATIRQLCKAADIDEGGWRRWRSGKGQPKRSTWDRVVAALPPALRSIVE